MIPILYKAKEKNFTHNGEGPLRDAVSCIVTEERNGIFEVELQYPVEGPLFDYIQEDCVIKTKPNDTSAAQLFRIYKSSKPFNGIVTYYGEHISYELNGNPVETVTVATATATHAINSVLSAALLEHVYTAVSDIETLNSTSLSLVSTRAALGGVKGSILDTYGGEYEFDNFRIKLHKQRGRDTGIKIAYGKNLTDFKQEKSISEVYTAVFPYAKYTPQAEKGTEEEPEEVVVTLPEKIIYSDKAALYARTRVLMKDFSQDFKNGEEITEAKLRSKTQNYVKSSGFDVPAVNITVSFVNLWQSPEYSKYALLERVNLCDTVIVEFPKYKVTATAKVIKTQYDTLKEQYKTIQLGDAKANFADTMNKTTSEIQGVKQDIKSQTNEMSNKLAQEIAKATALITGQNGGYVVLNPSENPQEILILDTPDIGTAVNVWRWNSGGLGHSTNGYNGPFELAMTMDGAIVADKITAGELNGIILKAGTVQADAISIGYKNSVTDAINQSATTVEQKFIAADEQLLSSITNTLKNYSTTIQMNSAISQSESRILLAVSQSITSTLNNYSTTTQMNAAISVAAAGIKSEVSETYATKSQLNSYSTTIQMNSAISQTSSTIMLEVNKKVNNVDFGTKITQNYTSVQIAWNNISKYIEFSGGAMNIYQSTAQGSSNLLMKMNSSGAWYYCDGTTIGKIGTNAWAGDSNFRGLVFDLEYEADYMCWAYRTSSGAGSYTVQLIYYANNSKTRQGLHFSCNTYCWGNLYLNENVRTVNWSSGGAGLYSTTHEVGIFGKTAKVSGGCSFECTERRFAFWNSPDLLVDCYNKIDMHNYDILNQSDARLKTNIQPTEVNALSLINQIDLKAYDWIENGEHDEIGIIAQQLRKIIPDLVDENTETGRLSIKPNKFVPYLIKAIQELSLVSNAKTYTASHLSETESWEDNMTLSEKMAFIEQSKISPTPQPEETAQEEILIPIRNGGLDNG